MRHLIRRYLPDHGAVRGNRWLAPFANSLLHPRLWHLNRRSAAGGVALGLFCGLIPGPFQMLGAAIGAVVLRVNLPLALLVTLYTNPVTIVPLYVIAYEFGLWVSGGTTAFLAPPEMAGFSWVGFADWVTALSEWAIHLGRPLALGLFLLASSMALVGYGLVRAVWRVHLIFRWRQRK